MREGKDGQFHRLKHCAEGLFLRPGRARRRPDRQSQTPEKNYEVQLDERTDETKYQYGMDDLSLVDTVSGQKLTIGMTADEVEKITGAPGVHRPQLPHL